jgi:hypothetical protein
LGPQIDGNIKLYGQFIYNSADRERHKKNIQISFLLENLIDIIVQEGRVLFVPFSLVCMNLHPDKFMYLLINVNSLYN